MSTDSISRPIGPPGHGPDDGPPPDMDRHHPGERDTGPRPGHEPPDKPSMKPSKKPSMKPADAPVIVIDASGHRTDDPEKIIGEYSQVYKQKTFLEMQGASVVIFDGMFPGDTSPELLEVLENVFESSFVTNRADLGNFDSIVLVAYGDEGDKLPFLELLYCAVLGTGSELEKIVSEMLTYDTLSANALSADLNRAAFVVSLPPDAGSPCTEGPEDPAGLLFPDIVSVPPSAEAYVMLHAFDGGAPVYHTAY